MKTSADSLANSLLAIFFALLVVPAAGAAVYKVTDDQGKITYTDTAPAETAVEEVLLPAVNKVPTLTPAAATPPHPDSAGLLPVFNGYSSAALVSPLNDSLVHFDQPQVLAQLALTPERAMDHRVQFYVDGSAYGPAIGGNSLTIAGLERGTHHISARVLSSQGAVLVIAEPVTVHVQRHFKRHFKRQ